MGDPAGIGPEIIIKSLVEGKLNGAPVVVVGCAQTLRRILALGITPRAELRIIENPGQAQFSAGTINVIDEPLADPQGCARAKYRHRRGFSIPLHQAGDRPGDGRRGVRARHRAVK
jgi:4-hydroxythreonine-4-phosphate dehydrogenase